jgi:hypothetical protein
MPCKGSLSANVVIEDHGETDQLLEAIRSIVEQECTRFDSDDI